jgi:hypothetical protein
MEVTYKELCFSKILPLGNCNICKPGRGKQ